jgi:hypothetical protein
MLNTVILVLDGADCGGAIPRAGALAARLGSSVVVVPVCGRDDSRFMQELAAQHLPALGTDGLTVKAEPAVDPRLAAPAIAEAARTYGAGLIVVARRAVPPNGDGVARGTGRELELAAQCPVVSVPGPAARAARAA